MGTHPVALSLLPHRKNLQGVNPLVLGSTRGGLTERDGWSGTGGISPVRKTFVRVFRLLFTP
jgi:hypothetical protein